MASIASLAPEYDMGVLEALDHLGLDAKFGADVRELDADREKWVRWILNEASAARPDKPKLIVCIGGNRSGKTYQGERWVEEAPRELRVRREFEQDGRDLARLARFFNRRYSIWLEAVPIDGSAARLGVVTDYAIDHGYDVEIRKLTGYAPSVLSPANLAAIDAAYPSAPRSQVFGTIIDEIPPEVIAAEVGLIPPPE